MAKFTLHALTPKGENVTFTYDSATSMLLNHNGERVVAQENGGHWKDRLQLPAGKSKSLKKLKISLGLSCNFECDYCSQRFVPRAGETNKGDIEPFLRDLPLWFDGGTDGLGTGVCIEFWGGEPLVYIKTLKPLAERISVMYPHAQLQLITNGSLLTPEINQWIDSMGFVVGISHDGPGQHVRGPDPLADPGSRAAILDLYARLRPAGRISINAMLHRQSTSRLAVAKYLRAIFGEDVPIGEGGFVDSYDQGGLGNSLLDPVDDLNFRAQSLIELRTGEVTDVGPVRTKIFRFIEGLATNRPASSLGQKCGMDRQDAIAVDLKGNVLTCQNVSAAGVAPNGQSHKVGHVSDLDGVKLSTATHWSDRKDCPNCPVLHLCNGGCMFLEGELWDASCNNAFSENVVLFAAAIELMTTCLVQRIEGPQRKDRVNIWEVRAPVKSARRVIRIQPA